MNIILFSVSGVVSIKPLLNLTFSIAKLDDFSFKRQTYFAPFNIFPQKHCSCHLLRHICYEKA